jgi:hypothetical protein
MRPEDHVTRDSADDRVSAGRTGEQEVASGRASWTPAALLGSVVGVVGVLVAIALALAVIAYLLA